MTHEAKIQAARAELYAVITDVEDHFVKIAVYPASIPIFEFKGRVDRIRLHDGRKARQPVAYLHFENEHLSFSEVPRRFRAPKCPRCRASCKTCLADRKRWQAQESEKAKPRDVLEIEDGETLRAIVSMLPAMKERLVQDSKVTPEQIAEAIRSVENFLTSI